MLPGIEVKMMVERAAGVEGGATGGTGVARGEVGGYRQHPPAHPAQDPGRVEFVGSPALGLVLLRLGVALVARVEAVAAPEADGYDVRGTVPVRAARVSVDEASVYGLHVAVIVPASILKPARP